MTAEYKATTLNSSEDYSEDSSMTTGIYYHITSFHVLNFIQGEDESAYTRENAGPLDPQYIPPATRRTSEFSTDSTTVESTTIHVSSTATEISSTGMCCLVGFTSLQKCALFTEIETSTAIKETTTEEPMVYISNSNDEENEEKEGSLYNGTEPEKKKSFLNAVELPKHENQTVIATNGKSPNSTQST